MFARRLRASRIATGYYEDGDFAEDLGVDPEIYRQVEDGTRDPGLDLVVFAAKLTDRSTDFLLTGRSPSRE